MDPKKEQSDGPDSDRDARSRLVQELAAQSSFPLPVVGRNRTWWPNWTRLILMSRGGLAKHSVFWLVATPLAAKLVMSLPDPIALGSLSVPKFDLPFSWRALFFGALGFAVGNLIRLRCPALVSDYRNFDEFARSGRGYLEIKALIPDFVPGWSKERRSYEILVEKQIVGAVSATVSFDRQKQIEDDFAAIRRRTREALLKASKRIQDRPAEGSDLSRAVFWAAHRVSDERYPTTRLWCFIFYAIGYLCTGVVVLTGLWSVLRSTFG
ncbi:MAG: hypothetical protein NXI31_10790 [bacterium]|nr:hypothetical protein [bacterium]